MEKQLSVLLAASECVPFVKTGGLADVAYALPRALYKLGADVRVVLPLYDSIRKKYGARLTHVCDYYMALGWRQQYVGVETMELNSVKFYFIDNEYYFSRGYIYGEFNSDEAERFGFFSKAVLDMLPRIGFMPDILHLNDWQTAMCAPLLKTQYAKSPQYARLKTVLTIHNLRFQGVFDRGFVDELLSLGAPCFDPNALEFNGCVNYLKGGIVYCDALTTVSPTYASEIHYPYYGEGLDGVMRAREGALYGILNGIDYEEYDPARDACIPAPYTAKNLSGKAECRRALARECGFDEKSDAPIVAIVSRLTSQKGLDLVERMISEIMELDIRFIVLGSGERRYENLFSWAMWRYGGRAFARFGFDAELSHRIYAGADMFLVPSRFEPCGLTQLIAMRYGTIPIVRETGGLRDTVIPYNKYTDEGLGFSFLNYNAHELYYTLKDAVGYYKDRELWQRLMARAMQADFSWTRSADSYVELYGKLTGASQQEL